MNRASSGRFARARTVLAASMLVMGACGIIYEYTLSVLGDNLIGSSHEQMFVIIGVMLFAMGVGASLQKHIVGQLLDKFLIIELLLGFVGGISTLVIFTTFAYTTSYQIVMYSFALAVGLLIGLEIPLLIRINEEYADSLRTNLSQILCMDYIGSLIGALLFAYVLLSRVSLGRIALALGCVNTLIALGGLVYFWPLVARPYRIAAACTVALLVLAAGFARSDGWMAAVEQRCYEDPIVYRETSVYQHLVLTQRGDHLRFYINGHLQFSSKDEAIYHELLVHVPMALAERRRRVLILGGGDGLALREVLKYGDVRQVTLVDIDPAVIHLASTHPEMVRLNRAAFSEARVASSPAAGISAKEPTTVTRKTKLAETFLDDREYPLAEVSILAVDADVFVRELEGRFDVVILDFPDPSTVELAKLFSVDFYRQLARHLADGATMAVQSTSPYFAKDVFLCINATLRKSGFRALPYHQNVPSFGEWGWHLAWRDVDERVMLERLALLPPLPVQTAYVTPDVMRAAFTFGQSWLKPAADVRPNTKLQPVIVDYYRRSWR